MKTKREHMIPWLATTVAPFQIVCVSVVMAVASEPLGTVPPGALVLDQDWEMQSSTLIGDAGASLSFAGQMVCANAFLPGVAINLQERCVETDHEHH
jgi:hypothetical protein